MSCKSTIRDRDGFCHLTNRCWSGKSCPTTEAQADRYRQQLLNEVRKEILGAPRREAAPDGAQQAKEK